MNQRMVNERAFLMAREMLGTVASCLRPEEHRDAFEEFYRSCKRHLEEHQVQVERMESRLRPSAN